VRIAWFSRAVYRIVNPLTSLIDRHEMASPAEGKFNGPEQPAMRSLFTNESKPPRLHWLLPAPQVLQAFA
jgi:hypothetical protein